MRLLHLVVAGLAGCYEPEEECKVGSDLSLCGGQEGAPDGDSPPEEDDTPEPEPVDLSACAMTAEEYGFEAPADPWDVVERWHWKQPSSEPDQDNVLAQPAIGDVDGDGDVEIAVVSFCEWEECEPGAGLHLIDGATGAEIWHRPGYYWTADSAMVDVDGDGDVEILTAMHASEDSEAAIQAVNADGSVLWTADPSPAGYQGHSSVADLDGDGVPEVVTGQEILDGATGEVEVALPLVSSPYAPVLEDLDQDGTPEVIVGQDAYAPDGTLLWLGPLAESASATHERPRAAPVSYDDDPEGEVLVVGGNESSEMAILDHDGTVLLQAELGFFSFQQAPCVADFDGDGEQEFAIGGEGVSGDEVVGLLHVVELDGTILWQTETFQDAEGSVGAPSCAAFDLDWDGADELLFLQADDATIFDGATGAVRYQYSGLGTPSAYGYPQVADLDGDGSAELVITAGNYRFPSAKAGVIALEHAAGGWPPAGPAWPTHDYAAVNVQSDLTVPTAIPPSWQCGYYRGRPPVDL